MLWVAATRPHFHEQCRLRRPFLLVANTQVSDLVSDVSVISFARLSPLRGGNAVSFGQ